MDKPSTGSMQILYNSRHQHWFAVTTVNYCRGEVNIYDSLFNVADKKVWELGYEMIEC